MSIEEHPTVIQFRRKESDQTKPLAETALNREELKQECLFWGADDVGFVSLDDPGLAQWRESTKSLFPSAKALISLVCRLNPENIRSTSRAVSDLEYLQCFEQVNNASRKIATGLKVKDVRAVFPSSGFPMEMDNWPSKMWRVSHKVVAEAAGLGRMGLSRILLHPAFGAFVVLGTILIDREVDGYDQPLDYNPCLDCKLCASVCPVGAVAPDGHFGFATCMTHNYRDRLGGYSDFVENIVKSKSVKDFRANVSDPETISIWQSMTYGICNKSSYCMAVCPAGSEQVGEYLADRKGYLKRVVKPLQAKDEPIYVLPDSDGEAHVQKRFPHKKPIRVGNGLRPSSPESFFQALPLVWNRHQTEGLSATYHFTLKGEKNVEGTVIIRDKTLSVEDGLVGKPDVHVIADGRTWVKFLAGEQGLLGGILKGKIRVKGKPSLLKRFGRSFPS